MRMMVMIIYLLFLICMIVYYGKMMYRNYQKELPLGYGQNKIVYFMILLCIIIGQYTIPSAWGRLSVILIFGVAFFLIYAMIGLHNRKNHSGELFRLYQKEVTTAKRCIIIGTGVVVVALFLVCFTAFTGAASHFVIGGKPDGLVFTLCVIFTLIWARIAAVFANKATPKTLNRVTGVVLVILGIVVFLFSLWG